MTRLSSRVRLHAPRVRETGWPKPFALTYYGDNLGAHGQFEASLESFRASNRHPWEHRVNNCARLSPWREADVVTVPEPASSIRRSFSPDGCARSPTLSTMPSCGPGAAMEAEPYYYRGLWDEAVLAAESALPVAWEIGEWTVVFFSSAWLAIAYLKLGQPDNARRILDRLFNEAPARIVKSHGRRSRTLRSPAPRSI